jgi:hypothetical protein
MDMPTIDPSRANICSLASSKVISKYILTWVAASRRQVSVKIRQHHDVGFAQQRKRDEAAAR